MGPRQGEAARVDGVAVGAREGGVVVGNGWHAVHGLVLQDLRWAGGSEAGAKGVRARAEADRRLGGVRQGGQGWVVMQGSRVVGEGVLK